MYRAEIVDWADSAAAAAASEGAAIAQAIKASGVLVRVEPADFLAIVRRQTAPLVIRATGGFFSTNYQYLTGYKGLAFFAKAPAELDLPSDTEPVLARNIWIPR